MLGTAIKRISSSSSFGTSHSSTTNFKFQKRSLSPRRMASAPSIRAAAQPNAETPLEFNQAAQKFGWDVDVTTQPDWSGDRQVMELPVAAIRRPLQGARSNSKVYIYYSFDF